MNFVAKLFLLLIFVLNENFAVLSQEKNLKTVTFAFKRIVKSILETNNEVFIHRFDDGNQSFIDSLVGKISSDEIVKIKEEKTISKKVFEVNDSAVLLFDTFGSLFSFNLGVKLTNKHPKKFQFFVYCFNMTTDNVLSLVGPSFEKKFSTQVFHGHRLRIMDIIQYQYFVVEGEDELRLMTFDWYRPENCNKPSLIEVNKFDKKKLTWKTNVFSQSLINFNGCKVSFGIALQNPASGFRIIIRAGYPVDYWGTSIKILFGLERLLNYSLYLNPYIQTSVLRPTNNYFLFQKLSMDLLFYMGDIRSYHTTSKFTFVTTPFSFVNNYIVVPPPQEYNGYEKLMLPFDETTWIMLAVVFAVGFLVIFVLNFANKEIRAFVFGCHVTTPSLNVTAIFFGISQITLPGRNFARFIVMTFILFCLIIRTAYQGKMFEFLQKNITKSEIQTIDELVERNFTLFVRDIYIYKNVEMDFYKKIRVVPINSEEEFLIETFLIYNKSFKGALQEPALTYYHKVITSRGQLLKRVMKERVDLETSGLSLPKNHKFYDLFNDKLQQLFQSGIISYYNEFWTEWLDPKRYAHLYMEEPQILTLEHLEAGFVIWLISLTFAVLVFVIEWFVRAKDFIVMKYLLNSYFIAQNGFN